MPKFSEIVIQESKLDKFKYGDIVLHKGQPFVIIVSSSGCRLIVTIPDFLDTFEGKKVWNDEVLQKKHRDKVILVISGRDEEENWPTDDAYLEKIFYTYKNIA